MHWTSAASTALAAFLASLVEFVEALTVVLAVGMVRGWRAPLVGSASALAALGALTLALGPALQRLPVHAVRVALGALLLLFGLRWLRKAVLRAAGRLPLHDEALAFDEERRILAHAAAPSRRGLDGVAFAAAFKIVAVEGIEVVFIVIAVGAGHGSMWPASIGALLALAAVVALGLLLHRPLTRVPENTLKLAVGVMVCAFGTFWAGEGAGLRWPGGDWTLLALTAAYLAASLAAVAMLRRRTAVPAP